MISDSSDIELDLYLGSPHLFEETSLSTLWSETTQTFSPPPKSTNDSIALPSTPRSRNGLKSISWKVREIVAQQGVTSYKAVADELLCDLDISQDALRDEKNIRRRVYDALNVLIAADILEKKGKLVSLRAHNYVKKAPETDSMLNKRQKLKELVDQYSSTKGLVSRNMKKCTNTQIFKIPFVVVMTSDTVKSELNLDMRVTSKGIDTSLRFVKPFEVLTSYEVITKMSLHNHYADLPTDVLRFCKGEG